MLREGAEVSDETNPIGMKEEMGVSLLVNLPLRPVEREGGCEIVDRFGFQVCFVPDVMFRNGISLKTGDPGRRWGSQTMRLACAIVVLLTEEQKKIGG
jgi:hypothetical protein